MSVITPLSRRGENEESNPYAMETITPKNMKTAFESNAIPIFLATTLRFIRFFPC